MRIARVLCCGAAALLLAGPERPLQGQAAPQQPTFKSTTSLVEVDVTVLDKKGQFVPGLLAEDLSLFEDGKPQKIQQFYAVEHDAMPAATVERTLSRSEAEERARRFFVFVFDEGHLSAESLMRAKKGAEDFIRTQLQPGDMAGVFANGQMNKSRMTDDKVELLLFIWPLAAR